MKVRKKESRPISRVLSWTVIPLRRTSPCASSGLPGSARRSGAAMLSPRLPYLALLQVGFAEPSVLPPTRCALTAPFHPCQHRFRYFGGLLSVALSVGSRPPGVTWHLDPPSPDFPPPLACRPEGRLASGSDCLAGSPADTILGSTLALQCFRALGPDFSDRRRSAGPARRRRAWARRSAARRWPQPAPAADP